MEKDQNENPRNYLKKTNAIDYQIYISVKVIIHRAVKKLKHLVPYLI